MNKYQHRGGVQSLISALFNLQLFANNKLISLDRMKDFLDKAKTIFFMQTDHLSNNEITTLVDGIMKPKPVDLSDYARNHIPNYQSITEIPQDNLNYLNSGLVASNMSYMFISCINLKTIPNLNIDTSQCANMDSMFYLCYTLTTIDLSNFNTSKVTNMDRMFGGCLALTSLDLSNFDTSNVIDMNYMFATCKSLTSLNLSNFDTSKVSDMSSMFNTCNSLTSLDLSNFDTNNVTSMNSMFYYCQALTTLDLSNFNTSKVTDMSSMFNDCQELEHIEGIINMKSCTNYGSMFGNCSKLSGVKIKNPPQEYYDNKSTFESTIGLASDQYEIVS